MLNNIKLNLILRIIYYLPSFLISIPFLILIKIISPLINIRFGKIFVERLGHLAIEMEMYFCDKDLSQKKKNLDIWFYNSKHISNNYLLKLISRKVIILPSYIIVPFYYLNSFLPGGKRHLIPRSYNPTRDIYGLLAENKKSIQLPLSDMKEGLKNLKKLGIKNYKKIICLSIRDQAYLKKHIPHQDWKKDEFRNPNIENYYKLLKKLSNDGYYIFRMGARVEKQLPFKNSNIIDYANLELRSEFMDIFLFYICKASIGGTEGLMQVPIIFRKPIAFVNVMQFGYLLSFCSKSLTLPTKFKNTITGKTLNFREVLDIKFLKTEDFNKHYEIIENTSDEIIYVVYELLDYINKNFDNFDKLDSKEKNFWKKILLLRDDNNKIIHKKVFTKISKIFFKNSHNFL